MRVLAAISFCIFIAGCAHQPYIKHVENSKVALVKKRKPETRPHPPARTIAVSQPTHKVTRKDTERTVPPATTEYRIFREFAKIGEHYSISHILVQNSRLTASTNPIKPSETLLADIKTLQPVYFATNRRINGPLLELSAFTHGRDELTYGVTYVSVPKNHLIGDVKRPQFNYLRWRYEPENNEDHFRIRSLESLDRDKFVERLKSAADTVLLFIHGYHVSFQDAAYKAAQIAYDANFGGSVLVFSWPSAGELAKYDYDRESADFSGGDLLLVLRILTEEIGDKQIYVVAHSLGNQVLVNALQQAALSKVSLNINELVLAAPDVDKDVFKKKASEIKSVAKNLTLYASSADKALLASNKKAWGTRMGYIDAAGPNLVDGIETIDITAVGDDMFGLNHGTYSSSRAVLDDLGRLVKSKVHQRPDERTPTLKFIPDKENVKYWLYPP